MQRLTRRLLGLTLVLSLTLPLGGCIESVLKETGPLGLILFVLGGGPSSAKAGKKIKLMDKSDVEYSGQIGGLSGTYDIDLADYGTISGTADIKGQFGAKLKLKEQDESLAAVIEAAVLDRLGVDVDVTATKGVGSKVNGTMKLKDKFE